MNFSDGLCAWNQSDPSWAQDSGNSPRISIFFMYSLVPIILYRVIGQFCWSKGKQSTADEQLPPVYQHVLPVIGSTISFIFDNARFLRHATTSGGRLGSSRIRVFGKDLFLFQDRDTVMKLWKSQSLSSPIDFYVHVLRHFFGMHERAISTYRADNSGPFAKQFSGSCVSEKNRIDHLTHEGFKRAFTGPGLAPMTQRYIQVLERKLDELPIAAEWMDMPDLLTFFRMVHGASLLEVVFGPSLTSVNPTFLEDVWEFDDSVPLLARLVPSVLFPRPYRVRESLHRQLKRWYTHARKHFTESCISDDGDGDPYWGSALIRYQQKMYLGADNFDDDALAAADLALVWGTLGNAIPTTMLSVYHVFKDAALLQRVRHSLDETFEDAPVSDIDPAQLVADPLLSSIQAETLRLYVNVCVMLSSPHSDISLGRWRLPKGAVALVHSGITHKDQSFWNTKDGLHPVDSFWADRFLTDAEDAGSGPTQDAALRQVPKKGEKPTFSLRCLDSSWMPYGGGNAICPGRLLAKRVTLFTIALMARKYDMELSDDAIQLGRLKFGMGVDKPKKPIPFRIRKKTNE